MEPITALTADENYRVNTQVNLLEIEDLTMFMCQHKYQSTVLKILQLDKKQKLR